MEVEKIKNNLNNPKMSGKGNKSIMQRGQMI